MDLLTNALKGQVNSLNFIILLSLLTWYLFAKRKKRAAIVLALFTSLFFLLTSTSYLPVFLISRLEDQYPVLNSLPNQNAMYVHALGGGYTMDDRLPANAQLSLASLARLAEAIRLVNQNKKTTLVLSGNIASGNLPLASVMKNTAIELGVDSSRIKLLNDAATTQEEARDFAKTFGTGASVILVTDAVHMPRAVSFFQEQGLVVYPAPTNFYIKHDDNPFSFSWWPSIENLMLMDRVYREFFANIKGYILN
jgi:uncharacterized SAM-binding protein YcdF (DUF218 family)